jgi:hypothetical protein
MRRGSAETERRRDAAQERAAVRASRTTKQQLKKLDDLLGEGVGAAKERARLEKKTRKQ